MKRRIILWNVAALMAIAGVVGASQLEGEWGLIEYLSRATADNVYVNTSGDTMTGTLAMTAFTVTSTTAVANLNADMLDGLHGSQYLASSADNWVNVSGDTMTGALLFGSGGTSIANAAGPLNLGTSATTSQGLAAGDVLVGGKFEVNGALYAEGAINTGIVNSLSATTGVIIRGKSTKTDDGTHVTVGVTQEKTNTTGNIIAVDAYANYNQGSGTGYNYDLLIRRVSTAVNSGIQRMLTAQDDGVEQFGIDNLGNTVQLGCRSALFTNSSSTLTRGELVEVDSATDGSVIRAPVTETVTPSTCNPLCCDPGSGCYNCFLSPPCPGGCEECDSCLTCDSSTDYTGSQRVLGVVYGAYASTATTCARGATCIICTEGKAQVLVDATATTRGYACTASSATAGRAGCYGTTAIYRLGYATESSTGSALQWTILK